MASGRIWMGTDNSFTIEGVFDKWGALTDAEILAATGTVSLYSDAAHSSVVSGADSLTISAVPGQKM